MSRDDEPVLRSSSSSRRRGRPPVTSRPQILAAARRLIDRDGWEKLTVRRLASELGIGTTTLYHHVRDKDDLLLLLLNEYASQIPRPDLPAEPRERIIAVAAALHGSLAAWPWAAEALATDGFVAVLGETSLWTVETILDGAIDAGCTPEQAVELFRGIWYYTVGEILVRARSARARAPGTSPAPNERFFGDIDASPLPRLAALGDQWPAIAARDTYEQGLRAFVAGFLGEVSTSSAKRRKTASGRPGS